MSDKPKRRSRWVKGSGIPRYEKRDEGALSKYREQPGWFHGARVTKR